MKNFNKTISIQSEVSLPTIFRNVLARWLRPCVRFRYFRWRRPAWSVHRPTSVGRRHFRPDKEPKLLRAVRSFQERRRRFWTKKNVFHTFQNVAAQFDTIWPLRFNGLSYNLCITNFLKNKITSVRKILLLCSLILWHVVVHKIWDKKFYFR